ncbi:MAG TPA: penicillin-binding protein 2 [Bacteroidales bacterium]|nr:penicillin-binding protein 2 [Bacteroidales bacterium]
MNNKKGFEHSRNRSKIIIAAMVLTGVIFLIRLFQIQMLDPSFKLLASGNVLRFITEYPARGLIFDRNGELMVYNEAHFDLMVVPGQMGSIDTLEFITLLGIDKETFANRLDKARQHSRFRPSVFESQIDMNTFAAFQEKLFSFPGFFIQPRTLRGYVYPIAAHTLGYIGEVGPNEIKNNPYYRPGDYIGISGIELSYEEVLRGRRGIRVRMVDVLNRDIGAYQDGRYDTVGVAGRDLFLTLDATLQKYGEELMQNKRGSIVAIEPSSGEILALVSSPTYDPNLLVGRIRARNFKNLQENESKPLFNRALMAQYPPGSAFKIINTLIALQEAAVLPARNYFCGGAYFSGGVTVRCRSHPGPVNAISSIKYSCNTYSCIVFRNLLDQDRFENIQEGFNNWRRHVYSFGFGRRLGGDLAHELPGLVAEADLYDRIYGSRGWSSLTIISLGIGQGEIGSTPLQMANLAATVANRGFFVTPHIVRAIGNADSIQNKFMNRNYTTIDREHFELMAQAMHQVVEAGTGAFSKIPGITMGGKTGTVQNPHGENHSVFIAFAPVDNPQIAISVVIENAGYGSAWAAPLASLMIEKYLNRQVERTWFEQRIKEANFMENNQAFSTQN